MFYNLSYKLYPVFQISMANGRCVSGLFRHYCVDTLPFHFLNGVCRLPEKPISQTACLSEDPLVRQFVKLDIQKAS